MRLKSKLLATLGIGFLATLLPCAAQNPQTMPGMQHEHDATAPAQPAYPHMGRAQEHPPSPLFTLEEAQRLAAASNPTLRQAEAEIRAAKARQQQSALYLIPASATPAMKFAAVPSMAASKASSSSKPS